MELPREEKLEQLERVLLSRTLQGSESLKAFLRFVALKAIDHQDDQLKEYTIATEVFGRSNNYDSRTDSFVRVQAGRLRAKLQDYYSSEGKSDRVLIVLPKGHYNVTFSYAHEKNGSAAAPVDSAPREAKEVSLPPGVEQLAPARTSKRWAIATGSAVTALLISTVTLAVWNRELQRRVEEAGALQDRLSYSYIWEPFFKDGAPTLLVLSNPPVYRFSNSIDPETVIKKSVGLTREQAQTLSEQLKGKFVMKQNRIPRLVLSPEDYTGMGEAIGLHHITDLFRSAGKGILLKQSRTVSAEDLKNHNVILLGSVWSNEWSGKLWVREDFAYSGNATIENLSPQPGEEREYVPKFDERTGELIEDYTLITVKPNISDEHTVMVLAGLHSEGTEAAAEYVTNKRYLNDLNQWLHNFDGGKPPRYYQVLMKVNVDNGIPTTISIVAIHKLQAAGE